MSATTAQVWPPNGKMVPVAFSGAITDAGSGVASASYAVADEYRQVQPTGTVTVNADGSYVVVSIESRRTGNDRDGRTSTLTVTAIDEAGNTSSASAATTMLYDQRK